MVKVKYQSGSILFVALIILLVITVLAVTGMRGVILDGRVSFMMRKNSVLTAQAETAVRHIERQLELMPSAVDACVDGSLATDPKPICFTPNIMKFFVPNAAGEGGTGYTYRMTTPAEDEWGHISDFDQNAVVGTNSVGSQEIDTMWHLVPIIVDEGLNQNPQFQDTLRGHGDFMYQVSGLAGDKSAEGLFSGKGQQVQIRTVYLRSFGG